MKAEDLLQPAISGIHCELIEGAVIELPFGGEMHGVIAGALGFRISSYAKQHRLDRVHGADTGFWLRHDPDTVRAPDVAFTSASRLPPGQPGRGFSEIVPDLVVEVVSPTDSAPYVQRKVETWLDTGVRLVWVVYPDTESIAVYRSLESASVLRGNDALDGGDVLPGFSIPVKDIFAAT